MKLPGSTRRARFPVPSARKYLLDYYLVVVKYRRVSGQLKVLVASKQLQNAETNNENSLDREPASRLESKMRRFPPWLEDLLRCYRVAYSEQSTDPMARFIAPLPSACELTEDNLLDNMNSLEDFATAIICWMQHWEHQVPRLQSALSLVSRLSSFCPLHGHLEWARHGMRTVRSVEMREIILYRGSEPPPPSSPSCSCLGVSPASGSRLWLRRISKFLASCYELRRLR